MPYYISLHHANCAHLNNLNTNKTVKLYSIHLTVDNIKMDLREIEWDGMDLIDLAQDRDRWRALVNTVMNLRVP
jgi:hypothetical protein